jgi:hypothetical protein
MVMTRQQSQVSNVQSTPSRSGTAMTWRSFGARSPSLVFGTELPLARHGSKNQPLTRKWCLRWPPMSLSVRLDPFAEPSATTAICALRTSTAASSHSRKPPPKHSDSSTPFPRADPNASEWSRPIADGRLPRDRKRGDSCKIHKGETAARRLPAAGRYRHSGFRLYEPLIASTGGTVNGGSRIRKANAICHSS